MTKEILISKSKSDENFTNINTVETQNSTKVNETKIASTVSKKNSLTKSKSNEKINNYLVSNRAINIDKKRKNHSSESRSRLKKPVCDRSNVYIKNNIDKNTAKRSNSENITFKNNSELKRKTSNNNNISSSTDIFANICADKIDKKNLIKKKTRSRLCPALLIIAIITILILIALAIFLVLWFVVIGNNKTTTPTTPPKSLCLLNCSLGYIESDNCMCIDINECDLNKNLCSETGMKCVNTIGSYCCEDVNECIEYRNPCGFGQKCTNTIGSYTCDCQVGYETNYINDNLVCADIDECNSNTTLYACPYSYKCSNLNGTYKCCLIDTLSNNNCATCGLPYNPPVARIVNGQTALPYSWPWMVSIGNFVSPLLFKDNYLLQVNFLFCKFRLILGINYQYTYYSKAMNQTFIRWLNVSHFCGGTLVTNNYVLTAAHCIFKRNVTVNGVLIQLTENEFHPTLSSAFTVYVGVVDQVADKQISSTIYFVESITLHENFDSVNFVNDIGLLKLKNFVPKTIKTDIICLPNFKIDLIPDNAKVYVIGFGLSSQYAVFPSTFLQQVDLKIYPFAQCNNVTAGLKVNQDAQLCVGDLSTGKDSCLGDSGSPLMYQVGKIWNIIGLGMFLFFKF